MSGAAALLKAVRPDASAGQVRAALEDGARRLPSLAGIVRAGQLDIGAAMSRLALAGPAPSARVSIRVRVTRRGQRRPVLHWSIKDARARGVRLQVIRSGGSHRQQRAFGLKRRSWAVRRASGSYRWRVVAVDASKRALATRTGRLRVRR